MPVGPSIATATSSVPVAASMTWSLPSQPARSTFPAATVGEQRIWSAMVCFQRIFPSASARQASVASCEPMRTRGPSSPGRSVGPPDTSPPVSWVQRTSPLPTSNARTIPAPSPTTTSGTFASVDTAAAEGKPTSVLNDQTVFPSTRSRQWKVPSRSPTKILPPETTGVASKAVFSSCRCQRSASGRVIRAAERPDPATPPRNIGQASAAASSPGSAPTGACPPATIASSTITRHESDRGPVRLEDLIGPPCRASPDRRRRQGAG